MDAGHLPSLAERSIFLLMATLLKKHNARAVLVGGYALSANNVQRATFDVDFLVTREDCNRLEPDIIAAGYSVFNRQDAFLQFKSGKPGLRDLDLLITDRRTVEKMIARGKTAMIAGESFSVPSPEHLIAMKLHALAGNRERYLKDGPDIAGLIKANDIDPARGDIRELFDKYNAGDLYRRITGTDGV